MGKSLEIMQGTLEFLILKTLGTADSMHGFEILRWIQASTQGVLTVEEGSLYPALHRMQNRQWIAAEWGVSDRGRRAKFYCLTASGRKRATAAEKEWNDYSSAVGKLVRVAEGH